MDDKKIAEGQSNAIVPLSWLRLSFIREKISSWLFAPEREPPPTAPTREEFHAQADDLNLHVGDGDYERELRRVEAIAEAQSNSHRETSKTIRKVFYTLMGTCLFCVITLAGTPDASLLTPEATVKLPVINYEMNLGAFLIVGPVVLIAITIYLHIFIAEHRRLCVDQDSRQPMLPNFDGWTPKLATLFIFYWMVPLTLAIFAWKAWPRPFGPLLAYTTFAIIILMIVLQIRRCPRKWRAWAIPCLILVFVGAQQGFDAITSVRRLDLFKADLSGKDLRRVNLTGAYLEEANLSGANLTSANLSGASLSGADLSNAILSWTKLFGVDLRDTDITKHQLEQACTNRTTYASIEYSSRSCD